MTWPGGFQSFSHKQHYLITKILYAVQIQKLNNLVSLTCDKHKSVANLWESVFRSQFVRVCFDLIKVKTLLTSQVVTYLVKTNLILKIPFRSLHTKRDFPNVTLQTDFIMLDKAERAELTEL